MHIRKFGSFVAFMLLTLPIAFAQSTVVNGTIVDPGGNIWANAVVTAQFQPTPNTPGPYTWSGGAYNTQPAPVIADSTGAFSITLPSNTAIVPSGSSWQFSVAPNATQQAAVVNASLSGGTLNLVTIINDSQAWPTGAIPGTFINKAYNTSQVGTIPLNVGAMIYNTTTKVLEFWNGTVWAPIGSGGGGGSPAGNGVIQFSNAAGNGFSSGAIINTDAFGGSTATQTAACNTVCVIFTPPNSTNGEAGESPVTLSGKVSSMWIDYRGNRHSEYFTNPGTAPSFPTFSQGQAAHPENLIYTEPNPFATAGAEQSNTVQLSMYAAPGFSNGQSGCPLFCPPTGKTSVANWTIMNEHETTLTFNSSGISDVAGLTCEFSGTGDHQCGMGGVFVDYAGGFYAPSDEGLYGFGSMHMATMGDWQGTIATLVDANHMKASQFANQQLQGQGRFILDFTTLPKDASGTSLGTSVPVEFTQGPIGVNPGFITTNSVTLPVSNASGHLTNDCTVPTQYGGVAIGQNSLTNGCQITVDTGAFVNTAAPVCMAANGGNLFNIGMQMVSNPTTLSGGHQTIFATMHRSVPAGAVVYQGGGCSWGISLTGDVKSGQARNNSIIFGSVLPIIGTTAHNWFYVNYDSSQAWAAIPTPGSQWGTRDTGNSRGHHGFAFATLTRVGGIVTGITGSGGQANPPLFQILNGTKFFSVSGCSEATMNSAGVNSFMGMPGPEPGRVSYALAGPDNVCTNATISMADTTVAPVFLAEVYDVANHGFNLAPFDVVDGTFAMSYQPNWLVGDVIDSPTHYAASAVGMRISDEVAQPMQQSIGLWLNMENVASYVQAAIVIDGHAQSNEQWGSGGSGYPLTAVQIADYIGNVIASNFAPAPGASVITMGFASPGLSNPATSNSTFRNYNVWQLNSAGGGVAQDALNFDMDTQTYCWEFDFNSTGTCKLKMTNTFSEQVIPAKFLTPQYELNFGGVPKAVTQFTECSPIPTNGVAPHCYNPIITGNAAITQSGTAGTTQYNYALGVNDTAGWSFSPLMFTFTGNATLSGSNFNNIPCTDLPAGKTGVIFVFPNPVMAQVGVCTTSATVVHDTGATRTNITAPTPMIDGTVYDSGAFRVQGATGFFAFSNPDIFNSPFAITASFSQPTAGNVILNGTTVGDGLGSLTVNNFTVLGTCTGCTGGGGGTGTVTNLVMGNLAPLFTASVATSTTTPTVSFTLNSLASFIAIANTTITLPTSPLTANTCSSPATVSMTGVSTTSSFTTAFATDPSGVTGWGSSGGLVFTAWPTTNTLNWRVCNQTSGTITPGAMTLNAGVR